MILQSYKIKFIVVIFAAILVFPLGITMVHAVSDEVTDLYEDYIDEDDPEKKLTALKIYDNALIHVRTAAIDAMISRVVGEVRINIGETEKIGNTLNSYKGDLNALTPLIEAETELEDLKNITKNIFWNFRVYHVVIPQASGLKTIAKSEYILENDIEKHLEVLQQVSVELENNDIDVSDLEDQLLRLESTTVSLSATLAEARENFEDLDPSLGSALNTMKLDAGKTKLASVKKYLLDAKYYLNQSIELSQSLLDAEE